MADGIMDFLLGWLLLFTPFWALMIISVIFSLITNLAYKFFTDQHVMKQLKEDIKKSQDEMKAIKDNPAKVMEVQKKAMEKNFEYMKKSMKPTLITFIPIILMFGWLTANLAYDPIMPDSQFNTTLTFKEGITGNASIELPPEIESVNGNEQEIKEAECPGVLFTTTKCSKATFELKATKEGEYPLTFAYDNETEETNILVTKEQKYLPPEKLTPKSDSLSKINVENNKLIAMNIFGWKVGWLGTYIILSLIISLGMRKLMNLY
jgi:uncharacterized membrane protein (DUF106 family)